MTDFFTNTFTETETEAQHAEGETHTGHTEHDEHPEHHEPQTIQTEVKETAMKENLKNVAGWVLAVAITLLITNGSSTAASKNENYSSTRATLASTYFDTVTEGTNPDLGDRVFTNDPTRSITGTSCFGVTACFGLTSFFDTVRFFGEPTSNDDFTGKTTITTTSSGKPTYEWTYSFTPSRQNGTGVTKNGRNTYTGDSDEAFFTF